MCANWRMTNTYVGVESGLDGEILCIRVILSDIVCLFVGGIAVQYIFRSIWDVGRVIMIFLAYTHEY